MVEFTVVLVRLLPRSVEENFSLLFGAGIKYESPDMIQDFVCFPIPKTNACNYKSNFK